MKDLPYRTDATARDGNHTSVRGVNQVENSKAASKQTDVRTEMIVLEPDSFEKPDDTRVMF